MVSILQAEGFTITERELMRLRSKHRLLLRGANASKMIATATATQPMSGFDVMERNTNVVLFLNADQYSEALLIGL